MREWTSDEAATVLEPTPDVDFVESPYVKGLADRALGYIDAGFPVQFRGPSGTGKTTLALHVAGKLGRPVVLINGDEELATRNLIGGEHGFRHRKLVDRFVSRVTKVEEDLSIHWLDNRLTVACEQGYTLIYDEFTRSRPEANNVLLSILEERILALPTARGDEGPYIKVHPNFTAIFTSNPEEYAGVHRSQDALRDRMITLDLGYFDFETEVAICQAKSKLPRAQAERIVGIVRELRKSRECESPPTLRGCIMIAKTLAAQGDGRRETEDGLQSPVSGLRSPGTFTTICQDILSAETSRVGSQVRQRRVRALIKELVEKTEPGTRHKGRRKTENRRRKTEDRKPKTEDGRPKTVPGPRSDPT